jgi:hypothetical protein
MGIFAISMQPTVSATAPMLQDLLAMYNLKELTNHYYRRRGDGFSFHALR